MVIIMVILIIIMRAPLTGQHHTNKPKSINILMMITVMAVFIMIMIMMIGIFIVGDDYDEDDDYMNDQNLRMTRCQY